jgi:hypothetical protein
MFAAQSTSWLLMPRLSASLWAGVGSVRLVLPPVRLPLALGARLLLPQPSLPEPSHWRRARAPAGAVCTPTPRPAVLPSAPAAPGLALVAEPACYSVRVVILQATGRAPAHAAQRPGRHLQVAAAELAVAQTIVA